MYINVQYYKYMKLAQFLNTFLHHLLVVKGEIHTYKMTLDAIKTDLTPIEQQKEDEVVVAESTEMKINSKPPPQNDPDPDLICPVCSSPSISSCRNCKKISYCGKAHQRYHWKLHKPHCFPLIHQYDSILGSRLISTRNIKPGEIIWKERPLLVGPGIIINRETERKKVVVKTDEQGEKDKFPQLCLGCCSVVNTDYRCPSCSWPMCGPNCIGETNNHEKLECKIFTREQLAYTTDLGSESIQAGSESQWRWESYKYAAITILRGILFKELDPLKWKKILDLDEMWNGVECDNFQKTQTTTTEFGQFCHEFIMRLNLLNVTIQDIALVLKLVLSHRTYKVYEDEFCNLLLQHRNFTTSSFLKTHCSLHLFHTACQATQNCVPNSSWIIQQSTGEISLRALLPIQFGRTVTLCYANGDEDILNRQQQQQEQTTYFCECERCRDSTELGTFFSALKCPNETLHENSSSFPAEDSRTSCTPTTNCWLLPNNTTCRLGESCISGNKIKELMWSCHECGFTLGLELYMKVIAEIKKELCDTCCSAAAQHEFGDHQEGSCAWKRTLIENLESLSQKHSAFSVHPNHATMFKVEIILLQQLSDLLLIELKLTDEKWILYVERFTRLCKKWLEVGDVLWPGLSRQRGQLLYYYQQALVIQLMLSISRRMRGDEVDPTVSDLEQEGEEEGKKQTLQDLNNIHQSMLEKQFLKIINIRKIVVEIFCYDDVDSIGRKYADILVQKCPEIELLKLYVFQNNNKDITIKIKPQS